MNATTTCESDIVLRSGCSCKYESGDDEVPKETPLGAALPNAAGLAVPNARAALAEDLNCLLLIVGEGYDLSMCEADGQDAIHIKVTAILCKGLKMSVRKKSSHSTLR